MGRLLALTSSIPFFAASASATEGERTSKK